jgi:hypothetical protein
MLKPGNPIAVVELPKINYYNLKLKSFESASADLI